MAKQRQISLSWPVKGVDKRGPYEQQAPYSTPSALNVWTDDRTEGRERGGSRPGLGKTFAQQISGGSNPIRLLETVQYTSGSAKSKRLVASANGELWRQTGSTTMAGAVGSLRLATDRLLTGVELFQKLYIADNGSVLSSGTDGIVGGTNGLAFTNTAGTNFASAGVNANDYAVVISERGDGTAAVQSLSCAGAPTGGTFTLTFNSHTTTGLDYNASASDVQAALRSLPSIGGSNVTCAGGGLPTTPITITFAGDLANAPQNLIEVDFSGLTGGGVDEQQTITITGTPTGGTFNATVIVGGRSETTSDIAYNAAASAVETAIEGLSIVPSGEASCSGGAFPGSAVVVTFSGSLGSTNVPMMAGDGSGLTGGTSPAVAVTETRTGIDTPMKSVQVTVGKAQEVSLGAYAISSVDTTTINLASSPAPAGATGLTYRVERTLKVYDPSADTLTALFHKDGKGTVPTNCLISAMWRGRLIVVEANDAHNFKMSRQGDPEDWDYSETDVQRAVAGNLAPAGQVGEPITAILPLSHSCLIIGCTTSIWVIQGDLSMGGKAAMLDSEIGILDKRSWCTISGGYVLFMSADGLYIMPPGCGSPPTSVSREAMPEELLNIDTSSYTVTMAYDVRYRGAHLFLYNGSNTSHWFIDTKVSQSNDQVSANFWPVAYQSSHGPSASHARRDFISSESGVSFGGKDGYIRNLKPTLDQDDGSNAISSHIVFGPFALGDNSGATEGKLASICAALARGSGDVTWSVHVGQTAEDAVNAAARESGTWTGYSEAGLQYKAHPRARGAFAAVKITSAGT